MSRSYRHVPILGIKTSPSENQDKRLANRALRRVVKVAVCCGREALPLMRELSDVWGFNKDGKRWCHDPTPRMMRK